MTDRTVFFISDGTGITAETFGNAILAQFAMAPRHVRLPFTDTVDKAMKEWPFEIVIPGHGPVTNRAGWQAYRDNAAKMRDQVSAMVKGGKSQDEVAAFMEKEYGWRRPNSLQQLWSVPGFMTEIK